MTSARFATLFLLSCSLNVRDAPADTLFQGKEPIAIGKGTESNGKIAWTDCDGKEPAELKKPPYWIDRADNCSVKPYAFGLKREGGSYVVTDKATFGKYFPTASTGDKAGFKVYRSTLELKHEGESVRMTTAAVKPEKEE